MPGTTRTKTARKVTVSPSQRSGKSTSKLKEKNKGGRPPKLHPDEKTLDTIRKIASLHATKEEAAAFLEVSKPTLNKFLSDYKKAQEAWEIGEGQGKLNLRRLQMKAAEGGSATMLIWLGKQLLGQKDITQRVEVGKPGEFAELEDMSDADLAAIARGSSSGTVASKDGAARPARLH